MWLSRGTACDLYCSSINSRVLTRLIPPEITEIPLDIIVQPLLYRRKRLLIADMDSTIIQQECMDEMAGFVGLRNEVKTITERAMRGEMDFTQAIRIRTQMFSGLDAGILEQAYRSCITITPGAETLIRVMRSNGAVTALVSGGFTEFTARVAEHIGFHHHHGNELIIEANKITGKVAEPIQGATEKVKILDFYCHQLQISRDAAMAVGDGANDVPMLQAAGLGVAFYAKPSAAIAADTTIRYGDLTSLLYIQGYNEDDIGQ